MIRVPAKLMGLLLALSLGLPGTSATAAQRTFARAANPEAAVQEDAEPKAANAAPANVDESKAKSDEGEDKPDAAAPIAVPRRPTFDKQSDEILESLMPITVDVNRVTVKISTSGRPVALGVIVDSSGFVLTKASELKGALTCKLADGRSVSAKVVGIHQKTDLALLKIEASQLPTADWSSSETPAVGYWIVTPKLDVPPSLGIVSVKPRTISPPVGFVGVELRDHVDGVRIYKIRANSPAEKAGMQINDIIKEVNGQAVTDRVMLTTTIQKHSVGTEIGLKILRGSEPMEFKVRLTDYNSVFGGDRSEAQNEMGGRLSSRRLDFPMALQHDTPLSPNECGGPIIDLTGKIVGVNIARSGRVDSLALPVSTVLSVIEALKSGELRPSVVFKTEIEKIQSRLAEIDSEMERLPQRKTELTDMLSRDTEKLAELKKVMEDVQTRLKELEEQQAQTSEQLSTANVGASKLQKEKERLESDLQKLTSGTN